MKKKRRWVAWLVTALIAGAMAAGVFFSRGGLTLTAPADILGALCDGLFVPGILLTGIGLLILVAGEGFFDIMSYGVHSFLVLFTPLRSPEKHDRFIDYKTRRAEKRRPAQWFLLIVGVIYLALAAAFLGLM